MGVAVAWFEWRSGRGRGVGEVYDHVEDHEQRKGGAAWRGRWIELAVVGGMLALMLLVEGSPIPHLAPEVKEYFGRWSGTVGELRSLRLGSMLLYEWLGFGCVAAPVLLIWRGRADRRAWLALGVLVATFLATWDHVRWGYFLGMAYAISLPWQLALVRRQWLAWLLILGSWYALAMAWDTTLFPDEEGQRELGVQRRERTLLREVATRMHEEDGVAPFLAPWWLSPALSYWSGQPGVSGSSHEGMPGIIDSARFFLAEKPEEAKAVLERRRIAFVVVDEPSRTIDTSVPLLGGTAPVKPLGRLIYEAPHRPPDFLRLRFQNQYYKLFWVDTTRG